jgi:XTP/dITP diphosphohydrolase
MDLLISTRNPHKLEEIRACFAEVHPHLLSPFDLPGMPEVEEDGDTLEANAMKKAIVLARAAGLWALADDTGLEVAALDGAPGVYSARYAGPDATYADNCVKLLQALHGEENRRARFRTVIALSDPNGDCHWVEGVCEGEILVEARGSGGFGYDPLFRPSGHEETFAEMAAERKNLISHRGRALQKAADAWSSLLAQSPASWTDAPG